LEKAGDSPLNYVQLGGETCANRGFYSGGGPSGNNFSIFLSENVKGLGELKCLSAGRNKKGNIWTGF